MTTAAFLAHLHSLGVKLWADGNHLRYSAPKDVLTPTLRTQLMAHKEGILALLSQSQASPGLNSSTPSSIPHSSSTPDDGDLPLSFAQQRLWFLDQFEPGSSLYIISAALRLQGALSVVALEKSLGEIVRRHAALRTTFATFLGSPVQRINPSPQIWVPITDMTALPGRLREDQVQRFASQEGVTPFDLARGPLVRAHLLRLGQWEHVLLISLHHIVSDGWSLGVLMRELSTLYNAYVTEKPSLLPTLPMQYTDFTLWQRAYLQGEVLESQFAYWRAQLAGAALVLELPTDRPRPPVQTFQGARYAFALPRSLSQALNILSRREGVTS